MKIKQEDLITRIC